MGHVSLVRNHVSVEYYFIVAAFLHKDTGKFLYSAVSHLRFVQSDLHFITWQTCSNEQLNV